MQYGYLPPTDPVTGQLQTWEAVTSAILTMQRFAGIAETGIPGMLEPACLSAPTSAPVPSCFRARVGMALLSLQYSTRSRCAMAV